MQGPLITICWCLFWFAFVMFTNRCHGGECTVAWDANNPAENVTEYQVWRGIELLATTSSTEATVTLPDDQPSTLTVTARNGTGMSEASASITAVPHVLETSTDLRTWDEVRTIYLEPADRRFLRLKYPK